jgi:hypothetical protein
VAVAPGGLALSRYRRGGEPGDAVIDDFRDFVIIFDVPASARGLHIAPVSPC